MKQVLLILCMLFCSISMTFSQKTISGKVTDSAGEAIIGANILVKESSAVGTITDIEGKYSLNVPTNGTALLFSYTGYETQEVIIGGSVIVNVILVQGTMLDEVVVTALGISRDKKSLGYSTQKVGAEEVATIKQSNFVNSLSGKVSGLQIRQNNNFGGSTNITIRGNNSLLGNNQPLFIVDGVPVSNYSGNSANQRGGGYGFDYGNAASDINADDIAEINVLKGAAATALYGSRGSNGVILVTTKKGSIRKGIGVSISNSLTFGKIDKNTFIKYQKKYGAGYGPYYGTTGEFDEADIDGDGKDDFVVPTYEDASYGGKFDPSKLVYQWESFIPESPNFGKKLPYVAAENTPVDFFETSVSNNTTLELTAGSDKGQYRLGYTYFDDKGIMPNSKLKKHNINFNAGYNLTEKLKSTISFNYVDQNVVGRNSTGYSDNLMSTFRQWWQTNVDIKKQKELFELTGRNVTWNMKNPIEGNFSPIFWDNIYWTRYKNFQSDGRKRLFGNMALSYKLTDWLSATGRITVDRFNDLREERRANGSVPLYFGIQGNDEESGYQRTDITFSETNYDLILNINKRYKNDLSLTGVIGANIRKEFTERNTQSTTGGLAIPNLFAISNSVNTPPLPIEYLGRKQVNGYYANASLGYKDTWYIEASDRYDISSSLPIDNNSFNYYSFSASSIFSNILDIKALSYGKLRFGYAEVGNDTDPLNVYDTYQRLDNFGSSILTSVPSTKNNPQLKPERTKSIEAGIDLNFLKNRIGLNFTWYKTNTVDQILPVSLSSATGYSYRYVNAGELENKGIEIGLNVSPVKMKNFTWDININWSRNRNYVVNLYADVENIQMASYQGGVSLNASKGALYGTIRGSGYEYKDGQKVVLENGYYKAVSDQVLGVAQADWVGGISNKISYKGLNLGFLIDMSIGGDVWSLDTYYGNATGLPDYTAERNELGNDLRDPVTDGPDSGGLIFPGVLADGTPNTKRVDASDYGGYFYWGNDTRNPTSNHIYDASFIKFRELSLGFNLPNSLINNFARNINFSLIGRNLLILHKNVPNADPESGLSSGNTQGYLSGAYPTVRTIGFSIKFDL